MSLIRQNFHQESEAAINEQINLELHASYTYLAFAYNFDRTDVALAGFHEFFLKNSHEEREHAEKLIRYLNSRGGQLKLKPVQPPATYEHGTGLEAMQAALALEQLVNERLLRVHAVASSSQDPHLTDFLEEEFLDEQVKSIKIIGDHITNLKRVGPGLGEYQFDKQLSG